MTHVKVMGQPVSTFSPQLLLWKSDGQKRKGTSLIILLQLLKKKGKVIIFLHDVEKYEIHLLFSPRIVLRNIII